MTPKDLLKISQGPHKYNFHSHTQFCDGRYPMSEMAEAARDAGMVYYGFSPHSPIIVPSNCNMKFEDVEPYLDEVKRLSESMKDEINLYASMEIDYLSVDWGPDRDYFRKLPLDYRIASVHFLPTQSGEYVDCDGSAERFAVNLKTRFNNDLRYVVEKFFEHTLMMIEKGGFDIIGHFDKIAANASFIQPDIEDESWYQAYIEDILSHLEEGRYVMEINTKSYERNGRFFPAERWWPEIIKRGIGYCISTDAHYTEKIESGRDEAIRRLLDLGAPLAK